MLLKNNKYMSVIMLLKILKIKVSKGNTTNYVGHTRIVYKNL